MSVATLDFIFPFVVFGYGAIMTFVLHFRPLVELAESRLPLEIHKQFNAHRGLALVCLAVGSVWSLQNLWLGATPL